MPMSSSIPPFSDPGSRPPLFAFPCDDRERAALHQRRMEDHRHALDACPGVDAPLSRHLAGTVKTFARMCWWNALRAQTALLSDGQEAQYVEGWVVWHGGPRGYYAHAWLDLDSKIVDPTLALDDYYWHPDHTIYVPFMSYSPAEVRRARRKWGVSSMPFVDRPERPEQAQWNAVQKELHLFITRKRSERVAGGLRQRWEGEDMERRIAERRERGR